MKSGILTRFSFKLRPVARLLPLMLPVLLSGCADNRAVREMEQRVAQSIQTEGAPRILPKNLVDQNGYRTGGDKVVLFHTEAPGETFEVRNASDDSVAYTGTVHPAGTGARDVSEGQFSAFQTEGTYYIFTETTGASFAFEIGEDVIGRRRSDALNGLYARYGENRDETEPYDVLSECGVLRCLLLSYEIHGERYGDDSRVADSGNGIPDLLDTVRMAIERLNAEPASRKHIAFAEVMARFSRLYAAFDTATADLCFYRAEAVWDAYCKEQSPLSDAGAFAAASELYRISGEKKYENVLSAFFGRDDFAEIFWENEDVCYGSISYLATTQPVNVAVRDRIREMLTQRCARIVTDALKGDYYVTHTDPSLMMGEMCRLSVANAFAYDTAYAGVIENHIHYFGGRNPEAVNYLANDTEYTYPDAGVQGLLSSPVRNARFVLMTGGI